jgi:cholesterol transport system auxiliary component
MKRFGSIAITAVLGIGLAIGLTACSGLLQRDAPPPQIYVLRANSGAPGSQAEVGPSEAARSEVAQSEVAQGTDGASSALSIQVPRPSADPGLSTELITLVRSDHRMDYYGGSRWADDLPDVVETLAIDTLRAHGTWGAVHESPSPFFADYLLQINIRRFEADYTGGGVAPTVHVVLDCTLVSRLGRDLLAAFVAEGEAAAGENRLSAVVAAFEKAANAALATMAEKSAAAAKAAPAVTAAP